MVVVLHQRKNNQSKDIIENMWLSNELTYVSCNYDSIVTCMVVVTMMVVTIMVIKNFVYGDVFKENNFCYPPAFYFGDVESGCMFMNAYNHQDTSRGHKTDSRVMYSTHSAQLQGFEQRSATMYADYLDIVQSIPKQMLEWSNYIDNIVTKDMPIHL